MPGWVLTSRQNRPCRAGAAIVVAEVGAGDAAAAERAMRRERQAPAFLVDLRRTTGAGSRCLEPPGAYLAS